MVNQRLSRDFPQTADSLTLVNPSLGSLLHADVRQASGNFQLKLGWIVALPPRLLAARAHEYNPAIKILLTSGYDAEVAAERDSTGSSFKVLRKPYRQADLARALCDTLEA